MKGNWTFQLDDGTHTVKVDINLLNILTARFDEATVYSGYVVLLLGEIARFEKNGHEFGVRVKGYGNFGSLILMIDGNEVNQTAAPPSTSPAPPQGTQAPPAVEKTELTDRARQLWKNVASQMNELQTEATPAPPKRGQDTITEITNIQGNQSNLNRLTAQLKTPLGVIPFVGAGLSIPFGLPGWTQFLLSRAREASLEPQIQAHLEKGKYEEAAEDLLNALAPLAFNDAIDDAYGDGQLAGKPLQGAVLSLVQLAAGPVITTNFDHLLERVFKQKAREFEYVAWGARVGLAGQAFHQNRRLLLKIHGDVSDRLDRILTRSDYESHYGDPNQPLPRMIGNMLKTRTLLFIGCSLNQDRIVSILQGIAQEDWADAHYAIVERPAAEDDSRPRARFLSAHGIRPIWYPAGRHDLLAPLLQYLVAQTQNG